MTTNNVDPQFLSNVIALLTLEAQNGNIDSSNKLAFYYLKGIGVDKNIDTAIQYLNMNQQNADINLFLSLYGIQYQN